MYLIVERPRYQLMSTIVSGIEDRTGVRDD